jgi:hypothetical protein
MSLVLFYDFATYSTNRDPPDMLQASKNKLIIMIRRGVILNKDLVPDSRCLSSYTGVRQPESLTL